MREREREIYTLPALQADAGAARTSLGRSYKQIESQTCPKITEVKKQSLRTLH